MVTVTRETSVVIDSLTPFLRQQQLRRAISSCTTCPLGLNREGKAAVGRGPLDAKVVIIGDLPGYEESQVGEAVLGIGWRQLREMLKEAGVVRPAEQLYLTTPVRCRAFAMNKVGELAPVKPSAKHIHICSTTHLFEELRCLDPRVIVTLGDPALRALTGEGGVTKLRGSVRTVELETAAGLQTVKTIATFSPSSIRYDPGNRPLIVRDLKRAVEESCTKTIRPEVFPPVHVLRTVEEVRQFVDLLLLRNDVVTFDTETTAVGRGRAVDRRYLDILCFSFTVDDEEGWVVPVLGDIDPADFDEKTGLYDPEKVRQVWTPAEKQQVMAEMRRFFESDVPKCGQNAKFDAMVLDTVGIECRNLVFDTILAHTLIDENQPHDLEHLRRVYTDVPYYEGWKKQYLKTNDTPYVIAPKEELWQYAGLDTVTTHRVMYAETEELDTPKRTGKRSWELLNGLVMPLCRSLFQIERTGMLVDLERLYETHGFYDKLIREYAQQWLDLSGGVAHTSPPQLQKYLYGTLELPVLKWTATKQPSTDSKVLEELVATHDVPALNVLLKLRKLLKQRDTYLAGADGKSGLVRFLDDKGYIHTTFNQRVVTGRLSSTEPNLQNITKSRDIASLFTDDVEEAAELAIRSIFVAPPGHVLCESDYCLAPGTRVLKTDLSWTPVESLQVGEEVIGFPEALHKEMHFEPARVVSTRTLCLPSYRIVTTRGTIVASADHRFVTRKRRNGYKSDRCWVTAAEMQPGYLISFLAEPWETDDSREAGYLAGFMDGEGFVSSGGRTNGGTSVGFGQNPGAVTQRVLAAAQARNFPFSLSSTRGVGGLEQYRLCGADSMRLLGMIRPTRLLPKGRGIWEGRRTWGKRSTPAEVLSVEYLGERPVVAVGTSTKTLIAEGFLSHNSQLELRIQAYVTGERVLLDGFADGGTVDQHALTAALVYGVSQAAVTSEQRTEAKRVNFAIGYGGGVAAIMRVTGWEKARARAFLDKVRASYPATEAKREWVADRLAKYGFVTTVTGRRRRFPSYAAAARASRLPDDNGKLAWMEKSRMERQGYNTIIQGPGSDFLSDATVEIVDKADAVLKQLGAITCNTLHDALYHYVPEENVDAVMGRLDAIMRGAPERFGLDWDLPVDHVYGHRWGEKLGSLKAH